MNLTNLERLEDQYLAISCDDEADVILDEFESELSAGRHPEIDVYVRRGSPSRRSQLYGELAAIHGEYMHWSFRPSQIWRRLRMNSRLTRHGRSRLVTRHSGVT